VTIAPASGAAPRTTLCPGAGTAQARPVQVSIGIIVSAPSLFGYTNAPGQLVDRSAPVLADSIRDLAAQPGTLFHRLLTDERGNLLDVTELGRFPSRKLGLAISYRDGACTNPSCTVPAARCDLDHLIPVPEGPTTGANLDAKCRTDHRAKTHARHRSTRTGPHTTAWTTVALQFCHRKTVHSFRAHVSHRRRAATGRSLPRPSVTMTTGPVGWSRPGRRPTVNAVPANEQVGRRAEGSTQVLTQ